MTTAIALPARVDLQAAIALRDTLLAATAPITIAADKVEMLGTQGLTVLLAGCKHFADAGTPLTIETPSAAFLACLTDLGADLTLLTDVETPQ